MSSMELTVITNETDWMALRPEWDRLVANSFRSYPFLEYWYLFNWWETWAENGRKKLQTKNHYCQRNMEWLALPRFSLINRIEPALRFIGQIEVTDYLDFICFRKVGDVSQPPAGFYRWKPDSTLHSWVANFQDDYRRLP